MEDQKLKVYVVTKFWGEDEFSGILGVFTTKQLAILKILEDIEVNFKDNSYDECLDLLQYDGRFVFFINSVPTPGTNNMFSLWEEIKDILLRMTDSGNYHSLTHKYEIYKKYLNTVEQ